MSPDWSQPGWFLSLPARTKAGGRGYGGAVARLSPESLATGAFRSGIEELARRDVPIPVQPFTEKERRGHHDSTGRKFLDMLVRIGGVQVTNEPRKRR